MDKENLSLIEVFKTIGKAMDLDNELNVYGRPGTETIPYMHKKPATYEEAMLCAYEIIMTHGLRLEPSFDMDGMETDKIMLSREIRIAAQKEKNE